MHLHIELAKTAKWSWNLFNLVSRQQELMHNSSSAANSWKHMGRCRGTWLELICVSRHTSNLRYSSPMKSCRIQCRRVFRERHSCCAAGDQWNTVWPTGSHAPFQDWFTNTHEYLCSSGAPATRPLLATTLCWLAGKISHRIYLLTDVATSSA